jgi:hypothetical protein
MSDRLVSVTLPTDENGMVGRQCPSEKCGQYFKVKLGTGLKTSIMTCPYCGWSGESSNFTTADQLEYAKSMAIRQVLDPVLYDFKRNVESLNRTSRNDLIQLKFSVTVPTFQVHHYMEKEVETQVTCDSCGLVFSIFGVFASCPDCKRINAFSVLRSSLEVSRKRLRLAEQENAVSDLELKSAILQDSLGGAVGAFDALGKKLRELRPDIFPASPKNLFQNYDALNRCLANKGGKAIEERIGEDGAAALLRLMQVRHVFEHNLGVVDQEFINHVPSYNHLLGRKYPLDRQEVERLIDLLAQLAESIRSQLYCQPTEDKT